MFNTSRNPILELRPKESSPGMHLNYSELDKLEIGEKNPKGTAPRGPFSFAAYKEPGHASAPINFPENSTESMNYNANFLKAQ